MACDYWSLVLAMNNLDDIEEAAETIGIKRLAHHPIFYWKDGAMIFRVGFQVLKIDCH